MKKNIRRRMTPKKVDALSVELGDKLNQICEKAIQEANVLLAPPQNGGNDVYSRRYT
jgi:hypothetical protein